MRRVLIAAALLIAMCAIAAECQDAPLDGLACKSLGGCR